MKELEDTKCEIRRSIDLQFSIWDRLNASSEEDGGTMLASPMGNRPTPLGNFFKDTTYAWLSCGPRLVIVNVKTGTSFSSWTFTDKVTCVAEFPSQPGQIPLLLVGLDNEASKVRDSCGLACVFDCTTSQVLRAIRLPAGVEQACIIHGGAEWEDYGDKPLDSRFNGSNGVACFALRNLNHLMVDLKRSSWEGPDALPPMDEVNPAEVDCPDQSRATTNRHRFIREKHTVYNLMSTRLEKYIGFNRREFESSTIYPELLTSSLIASDKINCILSGCLGRIMIWQTNGEIRWISRPLDENMSITHLALVEPTDDPRPFCYLWSAHQEETGRSPSILRMYAMLFERRYTEKGTNSYFNLESDPSVKFELELEDGDRITSLCPIVRGSNSEQTETSYKRGEDSLLLIAMDTRTVLFDLNQWYKEQMPHTIGECNNPNAIISCYRTRLNIRETEDDLVLGCTYVPETLREFSCSGSTSEELFYPNSLSFEWIDLSPCQLTSWVTRGLQAELLREMSIVGPVIMIEPTETFLRCVAAGLVSTSGEYSTTSDKDVQREALLSLCLEQRWSKFLLRCAKEWSDGSASYLFHTFLRWGMQRASSIKLNADRLSVPLYDQSGAGIGEGEVKQLRFYCQQLECIANVVTNLETDVVDLTRESRALRRVSTYLQVLLWFYDVGLLPESQEVEEDSTLPISLSVRIPYPYERLATIYREKRQEFGKDSTKNSAEPEEDMFIDELVTRGCSPLKSQWEREGGGLSIGGYYPPSSLQSLLRSYLTDCCDDSDLAEIESKHQITIYLLMDLAMLLRNSYPGVDQLIKYPSAFKMSPSLIKLTHAFWLLDHEDYHGFLDMMTGQLVSDSDVKDWHHRLVMRTLIRNNQNKLALMYLRVRKPPLSSLDEQSTVIALSVEHGLVQSAFHRRPPSHYAQLLTSFYRACKKHGRLNDILHLALDPEEEDAFVRFLENEKTEDTRLLYYLQRCRYAEASNVYPSTSAASSSKPNYLKSSEKSASLTIFNAYNATLPVITRKFSASAGSKDSIGDSSSRYPRPMSHRKSRLKARDIHEVVARKTRETYLRSDRSRIPFVSAPCTSLRSQLESVDTANSVFFVERLRKTSSKRSLDEMQADDRSCLDNEDSRKRRRTRESGDEGELGTGIVLDTPLVKRKSQLVNSTSTPIETPHSILKIRQLIRDSACHVDGSSEAPEVNNYERERKPRQIRFSLGQQRMSNDSALEGASHVNNDEGETWDVKEGGDNAVEGSLASEKNSVKEDISEGDENEEAYYSPEVSGKSFYEPTILSDTSNVSTNILGPRPRPSLRRSNNDSTLSRFGKSSAEFSRTLGESSLRSEESRANSRRSSTGKQEFSDTVYTVSILSSDTSFERTLPTKWSPAPSFRENTFSFAEKSGEKCRDVSNLPMSSTERSETFRKLTTRESSVRRSNIYEESPVEVDEDKNSEVLMEVDGFGLDRESTNQSPVKNSWDVDSKLVNVEMASIRDITEISEMVDKIARKESQESDVEANEQFEAVVDILPVTENVDTEEEAMEEPVEEQQEINDQEVEMSETEDSLSEKSISEDEGPDEVEKLSDSEPMSLRYDEDDGEEDEEEDDRDEDEESNEEDEDNEEPRFEEENKLEDDEEESKSDEEENKNVEVEDENKSVEDEGEKTVEDEGDEKESKSDEEEDDKNVEVEEENESVEDEGEKSVEDENDEKENKNVEVEEENKSVEDEGEKSVEDEKESKSDEEENKSVEDEGEKDEGDEVYKSLSNSIEIVPLRPECALERSSSAVTDVESKKSSSTSVNNGFNRVPSVPSQETNITDDESSRSIDESAASVDSIQLDKTLPVENSASGIETSDTSSFDSTLFSAKKSSADLSKVNSKIAKEKSGNNDESSSHSSMFSRTRPRSCAKNSGPATRRSESEKTEEMSSNVQSSATENDVNELTNDSLQEKDVDDESRVSPRAREEKHPPARVAKKRTSRSGILEPEVSTPTRMTRSRRASSVVQEQSPVIESPVTRSVPAVGRPRRAASLAKDFVGTESLTGEPEVKENPKTTRARRSMSLLKDSTPVKSRIIEEEPSRGEAEPTPVGRRTRRATSVQKETSGKVTRSSSKISVSEETEAPNAERRTRSKRTTSISEDPESSVVVPKRMTRASSVVQDVPTESLEAKATVTRGRKRGSSVPKEILETSTRSSQRIKRAGSVVNEVIPEEPVIAVKETKRLRGVPKDKGVLDKTKSSSPTTSSRSRLSSIASIPEVMEQEENDEDSDNEIFSWKNTEAKNTRLRRAASVDSSQITVKRRTRTASVRSIVIDAPINEEPEATFSEAQRKETKKAPVRKRAASATSLTESAEERVSRTLPPRRTRKLSQKSNETFQFSPPSKAGDKPDAASEKKETSKVPEYIFSPPHTRSKQATSQPRRKMNRDFEPVTEEAREVGKRTMEWFVCRPSVKLSSQTRDPFLLYGPIKKFSLPKRSKSRIDNSNNSTGSMKRDKEGQ